ncbi:hypothetical protein PCASD_10917 [Puccinia coronata f. sp. avenae]|uniref:MPN domain-containing protein n=1 Tax=Puccinia coronata f. sp. avenae TaxID=200324 RepID=A0A2N5TUI4_9BASI|nr:hypothetical protein PCASD_10917 [Puccinia coronata f. sp. avenae]
MDEFEMSSKGEMTANPCGSIRANCNYEMAKKHTIESLATLKILRHLVKYPHSTVIGLLVGTTDGDALVISDAIPLAHHWLDLSPMLEVGLALAKIHVQSKNLKLLGTYVAHSRIDLTVLDVVSQRLNDSLQFDSSIALVVDNQKLDSTENPLIPYTRLKANEWKKLEATGFQTNLPKDWVLCEGSIGDFDDHLEDLGVDWLVNPTIVCPT